MRKKLNKEYIYQIIDYFKKTDSWIAEFEENNPDLPINDKILGIDSRDFLKLSNFYCGMTESKEEFFNKTKELYDRLKNDRNKLLNEYFDEYEKIDYKNLKYDTLENCFDSMVVGRLSQFNSTVLERNKEFRKQRYEKDINSKTKYDIITGINTAVTSVDTILISRDIKVNLNKYYDEYFEMPLDPATMENYECSYSFANIIDYEKGLNDKVSIDLPDYFYYAQDINNENFENVPEKYSKEFMNTDSLITTIVRAFNSYDGYSKQYLNASTKHEAEMIFVDGVPLRELANGKEGKNALCSELSKAILEGKHIDTIACYKDKDGTVNTKIYPLDLVPSKEIKAKIDNDYFLTKHSWFRLTFFNWGPFKIKEQGFFEDKRIEHNIAKYDREKQILKSSNERLERFAKEKNLDIIPGKLIENKIYEPVFDKTILNIPDQDINMEIDTVKSVHRDSISMEYSISEEEPSIDQSK